MTRTRLHYLSINLPSPSSSSLSIPTSTRRKRRSFLAKSQVNIMNTSTSFARREVPRRNLRRTSAYVAELQRDEPSLNRRVQETQHATYHNRNNITSQLSTAGLREVLHRPASRTTSSPPHTPPTPPSSPDPPHHTSPTTIRVFLLQRQGTFNVIQSCLVDLRAGTIIEDGFASKEGYSTGKGYSLARTLR
jgi:hypothetical protein